MEASGLSGEKFWESSQAILMTGPGRPAILPPALEEVDGLVFFQTSGSTGSPKWIGHTRASLLASASAVNAHLGVDSASCWGLALPVHHVGGFGIMARVRDAGCSLETFSSRWDALAFTSWLQGRHVTHLSLVPTQVHDLVAARCQAPASLRAVVTGGGVLPAATGRAARDLGWPVLASYGMTETASQIATRRVDLLHLPYEPAPVDLLAPWQARTLPDGRLEIAGPSLFSGTLQEEHGNWKYTPRCGDWFAAADLAEVAGRELRILGRADALVKILGELVDPAAVEAEICALSGGRLVSGSIAVIAEKNPRAGCHLVLVRESATPPELAEQAVAAYHAQCPGFRRIARMAVIPEIPRSELGKVRRAALAEVVAAV